MRSETRQGPATLVPVMRGVNQTARHRSKHLTPAPTEHSAVYDILYLKDSYAFLIYCTFQAKKNSAACCKERSTDPLAVKASQPTQTVRVAAHTASFTCETH